MFFYAFPQPIFFSCLNENRKIMTKNNFYPSLFWISSSLVMAALFIYNLEEVTPKSSGIFPTQNVLVCSYIPASYLTLKKIWLTYM